MSSDTVSDDKASVVKQKHFAFFLWEVQVKPPLSLPFMTIPEILSLSLSLQLAFAQIRDRSKRLVGLIRKQKGNNRKKC